MGSGIKNGKFDMGKVPSDEESWEAYRWCIRNKIFIAPKAISESRWHIDITNKGKLNTSPESYTKKDIWTKIFEFYKYYYDKYRK